MTDITSVLSALITLISALVTAFLIPYLKTKIGEKKFLQLAKWVDVAVSAAEQIYEGTGRGKEKKEYVLKFLQSLGYTVDFDKLEAMIEAAVFALKGGEGSLSCQIGAADAKSDAAAGK